MSKNRWLKVAAVSLAVTLWLFVISRGQTEVSLQVPVGLSGVPAELTVTSQSTKSVAVDVRGHERFIRNLRPGDIAVSLDLSGLKKGKNQFSLSLQNVKLPSPFRLVGLRPAGLTVTAEPTVERKVPVKALVMGSPAKGFAVTRTEIVPPEVVIRGARKNVRAVRSLDLPPVELEGARSTVVRETALDLPADVAADVAEVTVRVIIVEGQK